MDEKILFPEQPTTFIDKRNAAYDGDPEGDFVLAEHINELQDAIGRVEEAIGVYVPPGVGLAKRIESLENLKPMRAESVGYFPGDLGPDTTHIESVLSNYNSVVLKAQSGNTKQILATLKRNGTNGF